MATSLKTVLLLAAAALFYLQAVKAQDSDTSCSELRGEFRRKEIPLFRRPKSASETNNLIKHTCFRRNGQIREFYSCPEHATISILDLKTRTIPELRSVNDLSSPDIIFACVVVSTIPPTVASTEPPTTEEESTLPTLSSCPSRPTRRRDYISEENLCLYQCSFGIAYAGISFGRRIRTVTRCCNGEPRLTSLALRRYTCAQQETVSSTKAPQETISSTKAPQETVSSTKAPESPLSSSEDPEIPSSSVSIIPASSSEAPRITVPTSAPTSYTPCPTSGPTQKNNYVISIRNDPNIVCKSQCSFAIAVYGQPIGRRSRDIYRCCNGEAQIASRALNLYTCP